MPCLIKSVVIFLFFRYVVYASETCADVLIHFPNVMVGYASIIYVLIGTWILVSLQLGFCLHGLRMVESFICD